MTAATIATAAVLDEDARLDQEIEEVFIWGVSVVVDSSEEDDEDDDADR